MLSTQSTMGMSARPERIVAFALCRGFRAVSIRCTMSWSVPCVASVTNVEPRNAAHSVYSCSST